MTNIVVESTSLTEKKPNSSIFNEWCLFIKILRSVGSSPLALERNAGEYNEEKSRNFHLQICSWATFYTVFCNFVRIGLCVFYYKDWGMNFLGRKYNNSMEDWIVKSMNVSLPFYQLWDILCVWITAGKLGRFCNTWLQFESKFNDTFSTHYGYTCTLKKWHLSLIISTIFPIGAISTFFLMDLSAAIKNGTGKFEEFSPTSFLDWCSVILVVIPTPVFILTTIFEEVKVLLMYRTLGEAFENIRKGIRSQVKEGNLLTEDIISQWIKLIGIIRKQAKLTGELQAPQQIVVFIHAIVIFTESFYLFIKSTSSGQISKYIWVCIGISLMFILRLVLKVIIADKITMQEQKLAEDIMEIDPCNLDMLGKLEARKITDLIFQKPITISFSGFICLRKQIIPKILSYVVGYLVVLFQFELSNGFNNSSNNGTIV